ncbi:hypothetical protein GF319_09775 [Candidatus Bathyarchaeota archaeon]|nr:hypothetical protein [Candidatus Bathyarchaeota archaeon]
MKLEFSVRHILCLLIGFGIGLFGAYNITMLSREIDFLIGLFFETISLIITYGLIESLIRTEREEKQLELRNTLFSVLLEESLKIMERLRNISYSIPFGSSRSKIISWIYQTRSRIENIETNLAMGYSVYSPHFIKDMLNTLSDIKTQINLTQRDNEKESGRIELLWIANSYVFLHNRLLSVIKESPYSSSFIIDHPYMEKYDIATIPKSLENLNREKNK